MGRQSPAATANERGRYDIDLPIRIETGNLANLDLVEIEFCFYTW